MNVYLVPWKPPGLRSSSSLRSRKFSFLFFFSFLSRRNPLSSSTSKLGTQKLLGGTPKLFSPFPSRKFLPEPGSECSSAPPDVQPLTKPLECHFFFSSLLLMVQKNTFLFPFWGRAVCSYSSPSPIPAFPGRDGNWRRGGGFLWGCGRSFPAVCGAFSRFGALPVLGFRRPGGICWV